MTDHGGNKAERDRRHDMLAERFGEALAIGGTRPKGPPERRAPNAASSWFKRGKLWDDVFTRTVANVLSLVILAALGAAAGLFTLDRQAWAIIALVGGLVLAIVIVNVSPVRYFRHQWWRVLVFFVLVAVALLLAKWLYGALPSFPNNPDCTEPLVC